jgi:hypothetical protein
VISGAYPSPPASTPLPSGKASEGSATARAWSWYRT